MNAMLRSQCQGAARGCHHRRTHRQRFQYFELRASSHQQWSQRDSSCTEIRADVRHIARHRNACINCQGSYRLRWVAANNTQTDMRMPLPDKWQSMFAEMKDRLRVWKII